MSLLQNTDAVELESDIPLELYLRRMYRPDCDYIDGQVLERNAGYWPHSEMLPLIGARLYGVEKPVGCVAVLSVRVRVTDDCVLVPDVCLIRRTQPREDVIVTPPLLCVEIITPKDTLLDLQHRIDRYIAMGVQNVWLIEERARYAWMATSRGLERPSDGVMHVPGTQIEVSLRDLSDEMDLNEV